MYTDNKKQLFSTLLAGLFLLLMAAGISHGFSKKKFLSYENDGIEVSIDADGDSEDSKVPLLLAYSPADIMFTERGPELRLTQTSLAPHAHKELSEQRLYILFHQLRSHQA